MCLGVVIQDSHGNMQAAKCVTQVGCLVSVAVEALVVLLVIQLCREMGLTSVHLEGDAKIVVDDSVNSVNFDRRWMGHVVDDSKVEIQEIGRAHV